MESFPDRLTAAIRAKKSCVVVGLDPRLEQLPERVRRAAFRRHGRGARGAAEAIRRFNRAVLEVVAPLVPAVKPQVAFYEASGAYGMAAFADTLATARELGLVTIADVKRGDVPSTAEAYAAAYLGVGAEGAGPAGAARGAPTTPRTRAVRAPFDADAVTLSPYLGEDSVRPFLRACAERGRGAFFLVRTSNPGARDFQDLPVGGRPLYRAVAAAVALWGKDLKGDCGLSAAGAVVGATYPQEAAELRADLPDAIFLVPGYGAQGAGAAEVKPCFRADGSGALIAASRSITFAYAQGAGKAKYGEARWEEAVAAAARQMNDELAAVRP
ncbi:MAG: orotidine-5'-phosphate decarboxylase [Planctomycetes bacterium]|nr:orotidine-5'-phosphate decarboxylase [Planctomycetota bacterium]